MTQALDDKPQVDTAEADRLFAVGRTKLAEGALSEACDAFRASDQKSPSGATLLNLGECLEKQGKAASARAA